MINNNIYESDLIQTPFVMGWVKPRIYLPVGLTDTEFDYILQHEQTHLKRKDHLIKPLAFFALTVHWFNPLVWLSFYLMKLDMEMSCDESVLNQSKGEMRLNYAYSLFSLSVKKNLFGKLAFGESNTKIRIKNILHYKKPSRLICIIAILTVIIVISGGIFFNPFSNNHSLSKEIFIELPQNELVTEVSIGIANDKNYGSIYSAEGERISPPVLVYQFKLKDGYNLFDKYNPDLGILLLFDDKWLQNKYGMLEGMSGYAGGKDSLIVYSLLSYADDYQKNKGAPYPDRKTQTQILKNALQATLIIHERENELLRLHLEDYRRL
ncbi:MAG: M56 family metallopeptidase [Dethiobacteraceae bacterium]